MSTRISTSIVIPNWNGASLLRKNLPRVIDAMKNKKNKVDEIIVVDDGSQDDSLSVLREFGEDVRVISHTSNKGFSAAVNTGVKFAKGTHICLLNTDVIPKLDFLVHTIEHLTKANVFAVTFNEGQHGPARGVFDGYLSHSPGAATTRVVDTLWVSGGSGVFNKKIWKDLRGMDTALFSPFYWEDVDLGYRAHKRGHLLLWEPDSRVDHKHESIINSSNFKKRYLNLVKERNELLFIWKNITSRQLIKKHRTALFERLISHPGYIIVVVAALLKIRLVAKRRAREKEEATVSDEAIFAKFSKQ